MSPRCFHNLLTYKSTTLICVDCGKTIPPLTWQKIKIFYARIAETK